MQIDREEEAAKRTWNQHAYIFGAPKLELAIVMLATVIIFWLGKDYFPWPLSCLTTVIYFGVRQWQVRREFGRFKGHSR